MFGASGQLGGDLVDEGTRQGHDMIGLTQLDCDITDAAAPLLPPTAGCGPDERIVRLPRNLMVNAKRDIPDRL